MWQVIRHPITFARRLWPFGWSRRTVVVGLMQNVDNAMRFRARRRIVGGVRLTTEQDPKMPIPTFFPIANDMAGWLAKKTGGVAQSFLFEALFNTPMAENAIGHIPANAS